MIARLTSIVVRSYVLKTRVVSLRLHIGLIDQSKHELTVWHIRGEAPTHKMLWRSAWAQLAAQVCMQCIRREFDADKAPLTSRCYMKANYRQPGMRHVIYIWLPDAAALDILNVFAIMPQQKRKRIGPSNKGVTKRLSTINRDLPQFSDL